MEEVVDGHSSWITDEERDVVAVGEGRRLCQRELLPLLKKVVTTVERVVSDGCLPRAWG